jgi:hypothetical protein
LSLRSASLYTLERTGHPRGGAERMLPSGTTHGDWLRERAQAVGEFGRNEESGVRISGKAKHIAEDAEA